MPYARGKHASKPTGIPHRQHSTTKRASRHPVSWFPRFPPVTEDIICTIGPKSWDPEVLVKLMKALPKMLYNTTWIGWIWRTKFKDTKVAGLNPQKCAFISNFLWILPPQPCIVRLAWTWSAATCLTATMRSRAWSWPTWRRLGFPTMEPWRFWRHRFSSFAGSRWII